jgi:hypothetical protein
MKNIGQKGEGAFSTILLLVFLAGAAYAGYVYLWPMVSGSEKSAPPTAESTPVPGGAKASSPAGAAVQGAEALGELSSGGR